MFVDCMILVQKCYKNMVKTHLASKANSHNFHKWLIDKIRMHFMHMKCAQYHKVHYQYISHLAVICSEPISKCPMPKCRSQGGICTAL